MHACMHAYMHTVHTLHYIHTYIHTYIHAGIHTYIHTYIGELLKLEYRLLHSSYSNTYKGTPIPETRKPHLMFRVSSTVMMQEPPKYNRTQKADST